jgi:uncharacterized protein Yka (UPF0111/DUF47 family)
VKINFNNYNGVLVAASQDSSLQLLSQSYLVDFMSTQWQEMMQQLIESNTKAIASNAKAIEALGNQAAEDRALIKQVGESAQQVAGAVARLVEIVQVDRERLARQEIISQSLLVPSAGQQAIEIKI